MMEAQSGECHMIPLIYETVQCREVDCNIVAARGWGKEQVNRVKGIGQWPQSKLGRNLLTGRTIIANHNVSSYSESQ